MDCTDAEILNFGLANIRHAAAAIHTALGLIGLVVFFNSGKAETVLLKVFGSMGAFPIRCLKKKYIGKLISNIDDVPPQFWDLSIRQDSVDCKPLTEVAMRLCGIEAPALSAVQFFNPGQVNE